MGGGGFTVFQLFCRAPASPGFGLQVFAWCSVVLNNGWGRLGVDSFWHLGGDDERVGGNRGGAQCILERGGGTASRTGVDGGVGGRGYLAPFCSLTPPPSPARSVVPLLAVFTAAAGSPPTSPSAALTRLDSGCSCSSPLCLLVGREAEAEA